MESATSAKCNNNVNLGSSRYLIRIIKMNICIIPFDIYNFPNLIRTAKECSLKEVVFSAATVFSENSSQHFPALVAMLLSSAL